MNGRGMVPTTSGSQLVRNWDVPELGPNRSSSDFSNQAGFQHQLKGNPIGMSFLVDHLAAFGSDEVLNSNDAVEKLMRLNQKRGIWPIPCILEIQGTLDQGAFIVLRSTDTREEIERFPMSRVFYPAAYMHADRRIQCRNLLLFSVSLFPEGGVALPAMSQQAHHHKWEMYVFQCVSEPAHEVANAIQLLKEGKWSPNSSNHRSGNGGAEPQDKKTALTRQSMNLLPRIPLDGVPVPVTRTEGAPLILPYERDVRSIVRLSTIDPGYASATPNGAHTSDEHTRNLELVLNTLNSALADVESFGNRLDHIVKATRQAAMRSSIRGQVPFLPGEGLLNLRSRMPTLMEFVDVLKKVKLSLNCIAILQNHLHQPTAAELVHALFSQLRVLVMVCDQLSRGNSEDANEICELPQRVVSPLLNAKTCYMLQHCLTSQETNLLLSLGEAWTTPKEQWRGYEPPYEPHFLNGFRCDMSIFRTEVALPIDAETRVFQELDQAIHSGDRGDRVGNGAGGGSSSSASSASVTLRVAALQPDVRIQPVVSMSIPDPPPTNVNSRPKHMPLPPSNNSSYQHQQHSNNQRAYQVFEGYAASFSGDSKSPAVSVTTQTPPFVAPPAVAPHSRVKPAIVPPPSQPQANIEKVPTTSRIQHPQIPTTTYATIVPQTATGTTPSGPSAGVASPNRRGLSLIEQTAFIRAILARKGKAFRVVRERMAFRNKEISVHEGEVVEVLEDHRQYWRVRNSNGEMGYTVGAYLEPLVHGETYNGSAPRSREPQQNGDAVDSFVPPPPPPPPPPPGPSSNETSPKKGYRPSIEEIQQHALKKPDPLIALQQQQANAIAEELKQRRKLSLLGKGKSPSPNTNNNQVCINVVSVPTEVRHWLHYKGFSDEFLQVFTNYTGKDMFDLRRSRIEELTRNKEESARLFSLLTVQKKVSGFATVTSNELNGFLRKRREKLESEEVSSPFPIQSAEPTDSAAADEALQHDSQFFP